MNARILRDVFGGTRGAVADALVSESQRSFFLVVSFLVRPWRAGGGASGASWTEIECSGAREEPLQMQWWVLSTTASAPDIYLPGERQQSLSRIRCIGEMPWLLQRVVAPPLMKRSEEK